MSWGEGGGEPLYPLVVGAGGNLYRPLVAYWYNNKKLLVSAMIPDFSNASSIISTQLKKA